MKDGTVLRFLQPGNSGAPNYQGIALSSITDRNGNTVNIYRNSNNYITQIQSPNGRWIQLNYDTNTPPRVTSATDNLGRTIIYTYDPTLGTLHTVTDANNGVWTYGYDTNYEMTSITDARQILYLQNTYVNGRVHQQILGYPSMIYTFNYTTDASNNVTQTSVTDPNGNVRLVTFGAPPAYPDGLFISGGYASADIRALGKPEQQIFTYSLQPTTNFLLSETDSLNRTRAFTYDGLGNVSSVTDLAGSANAVTTFFTHDPSFSQITSVTDPLGHTSTFGLDSRGNLLSAADPLGNTSFYAHDFEGRLTTVADPLGNAWQFGYYGADLTVATDPYGSTVGIVADEAGRAVAITDPMGQTSKFQYNPLNRITQRTDPLGGITKFAWDPNGNLQSVTDARNTQNPTTYTYDNMDRLQFRTDPLGKQESIGYDGNGNLKCFTDRRGQVANLTYDGLDRLTSVGYGATSCASTTYQSTTSYTYDAGNRPAAIVDSVSGTITPVFDGLNRLLSETTPQGSVSYQYDAADRQTSMTVAGQAAVNYTYDLADRLTQIVQGSSTVSLGFDSDGRRTGLTLPNGLSVSYTYDKDSRLTGITYNQGTSPLGNLTYAYDGDSRVSQLGGSFARTGLPAAVPSASYDVSNRLTAWGTNAAFSYDANGNLLGDGTNTYMWDARNQLSSIAGGAAASFQYDPLGRRNGKTVSGTTTGFLYTGANIVEELTSGKPSADLLNGGIDEIFARTTTTASTFLQDGLGSNLGLTNNVGTIATQYTYDPFGNTSSTGSASSNAFQYTGRENDGTGLYFYRARYYNPVLQRFLSQDPIGFAGGDANLYSYALNSPTNLSDASGNCPACGALVLTGEVFSGPVGWGIAIGGAIIITEPVWGPALSRALSDASQNDDTQAPSIPISTPADPNGRYGGPNQQNCPSAPTGLDPSDSWGNPQTLARHFADHGADFGATSADQYAEMASEFLQRALSSGLPAKIDANGIIRVFDPATNTFGSYNPNGTTKTFFKPKSPTYFNRQPGTSCK
jgi:RHS repeat-associated protein